jgi:hypothetical protein
VHVENQPEEVRRVTNQKKPAQEKNNPPEIARNRTFPAATLLNPERKTFN